jgi:hypothetical protein
VVFFKKITFFKKKVRYKNLNKKIFLLLKKSKNLEIFKFLMKFSHKLHSMLFGPETTNFLPDIKKNRGVIIEIFYSDHFSQYTISWLGVSVHRSSTEKNIKILQINKSSA